jgi:hypothetical protein
MRTFAPIVAFTFMACSTFAVSARADEPISAVPVNVPLLPQVPQPAQETPPRRPSREPATLARPTTLRDYAAARTAIEKRMEGASEEGEFRLREDLITLEHWFEQDTKRSSTGLFVGGLVMLCVGGATAFGGGALYGKSAGNDSLGNNQDAFIAMVVGGVVVGGTGLVLLLVGNSPVMKTDSQSSTTSLFSPSARLLVSPGMTGIGGTF